MNNMEFLGSKKALCYSKGFSLLIFKGFLTTVEILDPLKGTGAGKLSNRVRKLNIGVASSAYNKIKH